MSFEFFDAQLWDQDGWATHFLDFSDHVTENAFQCGLTADTISNDRVLDMRRQLASTHANLHIEEGASGGHFDEDLAEQVFSAQNLNRCIETYFQRLHPHYCFIHRPSFNRQTAKLPILLSMFLFGSLSSGQTDSAFGARRFFDIAEEYIFSQPSLLATHNAGVTEESLETLQAALLINIIQNGTNKVETRRRLRIYRHPQLISAIRSHGLFESESEGQSEISSDDQPDWLSFIAKESQKRYGSPWT
jgi:hypothetical protein